MRVMGIEIPQAAVDAGRSAMKGNFGLEDVRGAVARTLRPLHYDTLQQAFDYGAADKDVVDDRIADRLVQNARRAGTIRRGPRGWVEA